MIVNCKCVGCVCWITSSSSKRVRLSNGWSVRFFVWEKSFACHFQKCDFNYFNSMVSAHKRFYFYLFIFSQQWRTTIFSFSPFNFYLISSSLSPVGCWAKFITINAQLSYTWNNIFFFSNVIFLTTTNKMWNIRLFFGTEKHRQTQFKRNFIEISFFAFFFALAKYEFRCRDKISN